MNIYFNPPQALKTTQTTKHYEKKLKTLEKEKPNEMEMAEKEA